MKRLKKAAFAILVLVLSVVFTVQPIAPAQASAIYPVPHRSWIKLGIVAYQASMTPEQIDWASKNIDWFDSPYTVFLPQYKAKTDAPAIIYDNYYCLYVGGEKYNALVNYVNSHGLNLEDMFLHFNVPTTITFQDGTYTVPAGSRVPTYGWYGTAGDLTKNNARVVTNAMNADYRAFNTEFQLSKVNTPHDGAYYDGVFIDNSARNVLSNSCGTVAAGGGTYTEFPGKTRDEAKVLYDQGLVEAFASVRTAFGPKGAPGSKLQVPNSSYDNWTSIFPYIDGVFREFMIQPSTNNAEAVSGNITKLNETHNAGVPSIISAIGLGSSNTDMPREKMTALGLYYLMASNMDYFSRQDKNSQDPQTYDWFGALDYNVGIVKGSPYLFAQGADPSSAKKDLGTGTVTNSGSLYTLTDTTKNWPTDYWVGTTLTDSANNTFGVYHSGNNWISFYRNSAPYPISGNYEIGNFIYKTFAREYDNALMIARPKSAWNSNELGDLSAITKNLPATNDNPSGRYYKLNADGTLDMNPLTQITLRNAEGFVLIKESALNRPSVSKSVDKSTAKPGDILTYTLTYSNPTQSTYANARIEDAIPLGTTFVSASNGGISNGTKVIWTIGNLSPGMNVSVTMQVRVQ